MTNVTTPGTIVVIELGHKISVDDPAATLISNSSTPIVESSVFTRLPVDVVASVGVTTIWSNATATDAPRPEETVGLLTTTTGSETSIRDAAETVNPGSDTWTGAKVVSDLTPEDTEKTGL